MMSTAILTTMDTEQVGMQSSHSDSVKPGEATFAQTFEDRMGGPVGTLKDSAGEAEAGLQNVKNESSEKSLKEVSDITARGKGSGPFIRGAVEQGSKNSVPAKKVDSQPPSAVAQGELRTKDVKTEEAAPVVDVEEAADEPSIILPTSQAEVLQAKDAVPTTNEKEEIFLEPGGQQLVIQKEAASIARMQEVAPAKKTEKKEATQATPMVSEKALGETVHSLVATPDQVIMTQNVTSATGQPGLPIAVPGVTEHSTKPEVDMSSGGGRAGVVSEAGRSSVGATNVTTGGSGRKDAVHDTKPFALDVERTSTTTLEDKTNAADAGTGLERAGAVNAGSEGDLKTQAVTGVTPLAVHAMTSGAGIISGVSAGVATPSDRSIGKLQNSDAVIPSPVLPGGSKVQDGLGGATGSMETMPRMLAASPTALEVGIQNGTHGWLKVRAEMTSDGVVNASVSASSSTGQEMLRRELPSLTAYLQSEKVAVNTVIVPASLPAGAEPRGLGAAVDAGGSGQAFQRSNEGGEQRQGLVETTNASDEDLSYQTVHGVGEDGTLPLVRHMGGGSWLSVRA